MAMKKTAAQWTTNWANKYSQAGQAMKDGATALQTAPGVSATTADREAKMVANWNAAYNSGRWHNKTVAVSVEQWRNAYINKGVPNAQNSVPLAKIKVQGYAQIAIPVYNQILATIDAMPRATLADSIARAATWMTKLQEAKNNGQLG